MKTIFLVLALMLSVQASATGMKRNFLTCSDEATRKEIFQIYGVSISAPGGPVHSYITMQGEYLKANYTLVEVKRLTLNSGEIYVVAKVADQPKSLVYIKYSGSNHTLNIEVALKPELAPISLSWSNSICKL